jgi:hypothetical protein
MHRTARTLRQVAILTIASTIGLACSRELPLQPMGLASMPSATVGAGAVSAASADAAAQPQLLATIRQATAQYHRVDAALADGYVVGSPCEAIAAGGIGIHYRKSSLIDGVVDRSQPELLVYEPQANGNLVLVAVAFVVRASSWDLTNTVPPVLGDQVFEDKRVPDWSSPPFPSYELHVWVWKHNPDGMYATTNPTVSCEFAP